MISYDIEIPFSVLASSGSPINESIFPALALSVNKIAQKGQVIWREYASGATLPDGRSIQVRSGKYMNSINVRQLSDFKSEVFSDSHYAEALEEGSPASDMKKMLATSSKVRISKKGKKYLIIPFRWDTPGAVRREGRPMGESVHDFMRGIQASTVIGWGQRMGGPPGKRKPVAQRVYSWGERLSGENLSSIGIHGIKKRHMTGMVKMQNKSGKGGGKHSQYLTFRVMTEDSNGWIRKAVDGYYPAKAMSERVRAHAQEAFQIAVAEDIKNIAKI